MPIHGHCTLMYLQLCAKLYHCKVLIGWLVLPLGSSSLHFWDGLIMFFSHHMTPLTSHIRGHMLQLILPHMVDHTFYGLPYPSADSLDPMDHYCTFDLSKIIPKSPIICFTQLLIPSSRIYMDITLKSTYIGMCA